MVAVIPKCNTGIILCMRPANARRHYNVTSSLIGWVHTQNYTLQQITANVYGIGVAQYFFVSDSMW